MNPGYILLFFVSKHGVRYIVHVVDQVNVLTHFLIANEDYIAILCYLGHGGQTINF